MRVGKLNNEKASSKDEIIGEMINGGGDRLVDWVWRALAQGVDMWIRSSH